MPVVREGKAKQKKKDEGQVEAPRTQRKLTLEQKEFIIDWLASGHSPKVIIKAFTEEFGIPLTHGHVYTYDPTHTFAQQRLSEELLERYHRVREKTLQRAGEIPIAGTVFQFRALQKQYEENEESDPEVALRALEMAMKLTGGLYSNRRELTGKDGGPLVFSSWSDAELEEYATTGKPPRAGGPGPRRGPEGA